MPIARVIRCEGPKKIVPGKAAEHVRVVGDILMIVNVDKATAEQRPEDQQG